MSAEIIDGRRIARALLASVAERSAGLTRRPGLAVVIVGEDPASHIYVRAKAKRAEELGFHTDVKRLAGEVSESEVLEAVIELNGRDEIDGILVQLPLPAQVNTLRVMASVDPDKDVDGLHAINAGLLSQGGEGLIPCTPLGCMRLIRSVVSDLTGSHAVVVGDSNIVGKPVAALLLAERATVTQTHVHTRDTQFICRGADILVTAVGKPGLVRGDWIKPRAVVIDVGTTRVTQADGKTKVVGDVRFEEASQIAGALTPVPGGVGPMTIACLMENTLTAHLRRTKSDA